MDAKGLKQLAKDIYQGKVITDRHITNADDIPLIFLPLTLMSSKEIAAWHDEHRPHMLYAYLNKATHRMYNGLPTFHSMRFLNEAQTKTLWTHFKSLNGVLKTWETGNLVNDQG